MPNNYTVNRIRRNHVFYRGNPVSTNVIKMRRKKQVNTVENEMRRLMRRVFARNNRDRRRDPGRRMYQIVFRFQPANKYLSGKFFSGIDNINFPSVEQYIDGETTAFKFVDQILINSFVQPNNPNPSGGGSEDKKNDCLFNAIQYCLGEVATSVLPKYPGQFKKWLKIPRTDPIHIDDIPIIELKIKTCIHVVGDYEYQSPQSFSMSVIVELKDGHYQYRANHEIYDELYINVKNLKFVLFEKHDDHILTYDGEELLQHEGMDEADLKHAKGILYRQNRCVCKNQPTCSCDIETNYHQYMSDILELKDITEGKIDVAKHGYSVKYTALNLFYTMSKCFEFEPIDEFESKWLRNTKCC